MINYKRLLEKLKPLEENIMKPTVTYSEHAKKVLFALAEKTEKTLGNEIARNGYETLRKDGSRKYGIQKLMDKWEECQWNMKAHGCWEEYCKIKGYDPSSDVFDLLA